MKRTFMFLIVIALAAGFFITGCGDGADDDESGSGINLFIGTWEGQIQYGLPVDEEIEFTGSSWAFTKSYSHFQGSYTRNGNTATLEYEGNKKAGTAKISGTTLTASLSSDSDEWTGTFTRKSGGGGGGGGGAEVHSRYRGTYVGFATTTYGRIVEISATQLKYMDSSGNRISGPYSNMRTGGGRQVGEVIWDYIYNGDTKFGIVLYSPIIIMCSMGGGAKNAESEYKAIDSTIILSDVNSLNCDFDGRQ